MGNNELETTAKGADAIWGLYMKDVSRVSLLTREEERELGRRIRSGDEEAVQMLVLANLRFVIQMARKYRGRGLPVSDLIAEGNLGLIEAARRFDPERNVKFVSYAVWWIRQSIISAIMNMSYAWRLTPKACAVIRRAKSVPNESRSGAEIDQSLLEFASSKGFRIKDLNWINDSTARVDYLSQPVHNDEDTSLENSLEQSLFPSPETSMFKQSQEEQLWKVFQKLSPREQTIIKLRYGLQGNGPKSLKQIGEILGLSRERVRQIQVRALSKLRPRIEGSGTARRINRQHRIMAKAIA